MFRFTEYTINTIPGVWRASIFILGIQRDFDDLDAWWHANYLEWHNAERGPQIAYDLPLYRQEYTFYTKKAALVFWVKWLSHEDWPIA